MSQIRCGSLTKSSEGGVEFLGRIRLASRLNGVLVFRKHPRAMPGSEESKSPDYEVFRRATDGEVACGAAWIKYSAHQEDFLSITLDDPDWSSPLNLTAFPPAQERGETSWQVIWSRPRGQRVQDQREAA